MRRIPALPDPLFTAPMLWRGFLIWSCARVALALATWLMSGRSEPLTLAVTRGASAWIVLLVGALGIVEIRRRNEHLFLANCGIPLGTLGVLAAAPALIGEVAIALLHLDGAARS